MRRGTIFHSSRLEDRFGESSNVLSSNLKDAKTDMILKEAVIPPDVLKMIDLDTVKQYSILPLHFDPTSKILQVVADSVDVAKVLPQLERKAGVSIDFLFTDKMNLREGINHHYQISIEHCAVNQVPLNFVSTSVEEEPEEQEEDTQSMTGPSAEFVDTLFRHAIERRASDIHMDPYANGNIRIRFRIDGVLIDVSDQFIPLTKKNAKAITNRIKILSELDIGKAKEIQDGSLKIQVDSETENHRKVDFRLNFLPTDIGAQKPVLRVLDTNKTALNLEDLGFWPEEIQMLMRLSRRSHGMILIAGPTGSGKTTTLYSLMHTYDSESLNICTVENPVEYHVDGFTQVSVKENMDFAVVLKAFLRQDPDVILVGETRDKETARTAIEAAQTGHLLYTTLHTNDAVSTVNRMLTLGVAPSMLYSEMLAIVAQRLVRKICPYCSEDYTPSDELWNCLNSEEQNYLSQGHMKKGRGCPRCYNLGYYDRMVVPEILTFDNHTRSRFIQNADPIDNTLWLQKHKKFVTMWDRGLSLVKQGITTLDEVIRVFYDGENKLRSED